MSENKEQGERSDSTVEIPVGKYFNKVRNNPWILSTFVLGIVLLVVLIFSGGSGGITGNVIGEQTVSTKILDLAKTQIPDATIKSVKQTDGHYEVVLSSASQGEFPILVSLDGNYFLQPIVAQDAGTAQAGVTETPVSGSTFSSTGDPVCTDSSGKPYVILFSTTWCPHCEWIKGTFDSLAKDSLNSKINLQHWEVDIGDNTLTSAVEDEVPAEVLALYKKYNPAGSIPTFVFGCSYIRTGNGYERENNLSAETADFKLIINKLLAE